LDPDARLLAEERMRRRDREEARRSGRLTSAFMDDGTFCFPNFCFLLSLCMGCR
jgi:hypothetical protein